MNNQTATLPANQVLNVRDLAELLRTSERTIRRMHNSHRLPPPFRFPGSNQLRWRYQEIARWLDTLVEVES